MAIDMDYSSSDNFDSDEDYVDDDGGPSRKISTPTKVDLPVSLFDVSRAVFVTRVVFEMMSHHPYPILSPKNTCMTLQKTPAKRNQKATSTAASKTKKGTTVRKKKAALAEVNTASNNVSTQLPMTNGETNGTVGPTKAAPSRNHDAEKTIEEIYQKKTQLEHILLRPDTYIGSVEKISQGLWVFDSEKKSLIYRSAGRWIFFL